MEYKSVQDASEFCYHPLSCSLERKEIRKGIEFEATKESNRKGEFSETLGEIFSKISHFFDSNNKPELLNAIIEANNLNSYDIEQFYKNDELIKNIIESGVLQKMMEIIFDDYSEDMFMPEDLEYDIMEEEAMGPEETLELNKLLVYNGLVFLMLMTAFSTDLSCALASMNYFQRFFNSFEWYESNYIKIGMIIGINILIDSTPEMIRDFNLRGNITQVFVNIAANSNFPPNIAEKITPETVIMACDALYVFTIRGCDYEQYYVQGFLDSVSRLSAFVPDAGKVKLLGAMNSLLSRREVDPAFLFAENATASPIINNLLSAAISDFVPLRMQSIRMLRFGIDSSMVEDEIKEKIVKTIDLGALNAIIEQGPEDINEILSMIYDFCSIGPDYISYLIETSTLNAIVEGFDNFPYKTRLLCLKIFSFIVTTSNSAIEEQIYQMHALHIFYSMLGETTVVNNEIINALNIFLFKINAHRDEFIEEAKDESVDEALLGSDPSEELDSLLKILGIVE